MHHLLCLLLLLALSCQSAYQPAPNPVQYSVPAEIEPSLAAFQLAAAEHHYAVSTINLLITFDSAQSQDSCGECLLEAGKTPHVIVNGDAYCWQQASAQERECLVFHELGHCLLSQGHRKDRFAAGAYKGLINPDDVGVYATCRYPIGGIFVTSGVGGGIILTNCSTRRPPSLFGRSRWPATGYAQRSSC